MEVKVKIDPYNNQGLSGLNISKKKIITLHTTMEDRNKEKLWQYDRKAKISTTAMERRNFLRIGSNSSDSTAKITAKSVCCASVT